MGGDRQRTPADIDWHHSIPLPDGTITDGDVSLQNHRRKAEYIPTDLEDQTVLDVGAWDGYFSFECEGRGAERVVAIDADQHGQGTDGFRFAAEQLDSDVEYRLGDVVTEEFDSSFDTVICFGVLYHVPDPAGLLDRLFDLAEETLCIETAIFPSPLGRATMYDNHGVTSLFENTTYYVPTLAWVRQNIQQRDGRIEAADVHLGHDIGRYVPSPIQRLPVHRVVPARFVGRISVN